MQERHFTVYRETEQVLLNGRPYTLQVLRTEEMTRDGRRRTVYADIRFHSADIPAELQRLFSGVHIKNRNGSAPYPERRSA